MQILANALPGFRDLRAPVITGYMWLLFAWLLVDPNLSHRPQSSLGGAIFDLGERVGHLGIAVAVSVAAYLVGSISQGIPALIARGQKLASGSLISNGHGLRNPALREISDLAGNLEREIASEIARLEDDPRSSYANERLTRFYSFRERLDQRYDRAKFEAERELSLPATLLVGDKPELFAEVDRQHAEGELRLAVIPPLVALVILAACDSPWWMFGAPLLLVLFADGLRRNDESKQLIANAISRGTIRSLAAERFKDWILTEQAIFQPGETLAA